MGRESATYLLALSARDADALVARFDEAGLECVASAGERVDYLLRDPHRYWIDLRVHRGAEPRLEIRIALTNDTWSLRAPLERVLMPLPAGLAGRPLRDDDGNEIALAGAEGWSLALEDDYARRRDAFIARIGDFTAPVSADHVYMYVHQTRWNTDNDDELAWHREREIAQIEEMWDGGSPGASGASTDPGGDAPPEPPRDAT